MALSRKSREQPNRRTRILLDTITAFNKGEKAVAELVGPEKARELFAAQEDVARKVHRDPPESIRHMRFGS